MAGGSNNSPCPKSTWGPSQQPSGQSSPAEEAACEHDHGPAATPNSHIKHCTDKEAQTSPTASGLVTDRYRAGQRRRPTNKTASVHALLGHFQWVSMSNKALSQEAKKVPLSRMFYNKRRHKGLHNN